MRLEAVGFFLVGALVGYYFISHMKKTGRAY
jgi:hypothetical protein